MPLAFHKALHDNNVKAKIYEQFSCDSNSGYTADTSIHSLQFTPIHPLQSALHIKYRYTNSSLQCTTSLATHL